MDNYVVVSTSDGIMGAVDTRTGEVLICGDAMLERGYRDAMLLAMIDGDKLTQIDDWAYFQESTVRKVSTDPEYQERLNGIVRKIRDFVANEPEAEEIARNAVSAQSGSPHTSPSRLSKS